MALFNPLFSAKQEIYLASHTHFISSNFIKMTFTELRELKYILRLHNYSFGCFHETILGDNVVRHQ